MLKDIIDKLSSAGTDSILNQISENLKLAEEKHLIEKLEKLFTLAEYLIALGKLIRIKQLKNQDKVKPLEIETYSEYKTFYSLCASYIDCFTDFYILFKEHSSINNLDNRIENSPLISLAKRELEAHYINLYYLDENKHDCQQMWEYLVYMDKFMISFFIPEELEKLKKSFYLKYIANKEKREKIESGEEPFPRNFRLDRWTKKEQNVLIQQGIYKKNNDSSYHLLTAFKDLHSIQGHSDTLKTSMTFFSKKMNLLLEGLVFCQYLGLFIDVVFYFQELTSDPSGKNDWASLLKEFDEQKDYLLMFVKHLRNDRLDNETIDNSKEFRDAENYIVDIIPEAKLVDPPVLNRGRDYPHRQDILKALNYRFMYNWISKGSSEVFGIPQWSDFEGELFRIEADRILKRLGGSIPEENLKCKVVSDKEDFYRQRFYAKISQIQND